MPCAVAGLFVCAALAALVVPGARLRLGPIRVSFGDASRLWFQAALAALVAVAAAPGALRRPAVVAAAVAAVLTAGAADSTVRRVGDGAEYLAMALQVAGGRAPSFSADDLRAVESRLAATPGFGDSRLVQPSFVGRDGRQDVAHFWLYPVLVAPVLAITERLGLHPGLAFTGLHLGLLTGLAWLLARRGDPMAAAVVAAGPLTWWVDKAHADVFLAVTIAAAMCLHPGRPVAALTAAGLAAAQNPATLPLLAVLGGATWADRHRLGPLVTRQALAAGTILASLHPLYYLWHLGRWSSLAGAVSGHVPSLRAIATPVLDPNLGLVPNAWAAVALCGLGAWVAPRRERLTVAAVALGVLAAAALTPNVNHGGSPGVSRYGVWLLAVTTPWIVTGARRVREWPAAVALVVLMASALSTWSVYRPALGERSGGGPSVLSAWIWTRWPSADAPLPEVFAERASRRDGRPPVPVAIEGCSKVLTRGDGTEAWWPFPCEPRTAPPECVAAEALCYADGQRVITPAPRQAGFSWDPVPERSWTVSRRGGLTDLAARIGGPAGTTPLGRARWIADAYDVQLPQIVEGPHGVAMWLRVEPGAAPTLTLRLDGETRVELRDTDTGETLVSESRVAGIHDLKLPVRRSLLLVAVVSR